MNFTEISIETTGAEDSGTTARTVSTETTEVTSGTTAGAANSDIVRRIGIDRMVNDHSNHKMIRLTLYLAVKIFDLYCKRKESVTRVHIDYVAVACLLIASKVEEGRSHGILNTYHPWRDQIVATEWEVLQTIGFYIPLLKPNVFTYLLHSLKLSNATSASTRTALIAEYLVQLNMCTTIFLKIKPRYIAAACVYAALFYEQFSTTGARQLTRNEATSALAKDAKCTEDELAVLAFEMVHNLRFASVEYEGQVFNAVWTKYTSDVYDSVALLHML